MLHSNDWMNVHHFVDGVKAQRFCLTLLGMARLWYHPLEPINVDWPELQNSFRQQYSKVGNTREQLFHAWRSFNFDENIKTIDVYVTQIRQVATLLGCGELQILEVFKNTLATKLYCILFPIEDLRQAVETAKRILTKEKFDKELTGEASTSPIMSIREGAGRRVLFDMREELNDKIDKLTVMAGKLAAKYSSRIRQFKLQIHQSRGRGQNRGYGQEIIRIGTGQIIDQIVGIEDSLGKTEIYPDLSKVIEGVVSKIIPEDTVDRIAEENIGVIVIEMMVTTEIGAGLEKDCFQEIMAVIEQEV